MNDARMNARHLLERPETGDLRYDATLPNPGAFEEFMTAQFPNGPACGQFGPEDMHLAFAAGWEAAILDHDC